MGQPVWHRWEGAGSAGQGAGARLGGAIAATPGLPAMRLAALAEKAEKDWLGIEAWKRRLEAAGLTRAIGRKVETLRGYILPQDLQVSVTRNYGETAEHKSNDKAGEVIAAGCPRCGARYTITSEALEAFRRDQAK